MKAHEVYENVDSIPVGCFATLTAAGAGDNVEVVAAAGIDMIDYMSAKLVVYCRHTLTAAKTLALTIKVGESADNVSFDADETLVTAAVVATGASTNGETAYELKLDLSALKARKRYLRFKITPDLSNSATDTATIAAVLERGGARVKAVTH